MEAGAGLEPAQLHRPYRLGDPALIVARCCDPSLRAPYKRAGARIGERPRFATPATHPSRLECTLGCLVLPLPYYPQHCCDCVALFRMVPRTEVFLGYQKSTILPAADVCVSGRYPTFPSHALRPRLSQVKPRLCSLLLSGVGIPHRGWDTQSRA